MNWCSGEADVCFTLGTHLHVGNVAQFVTLTSHLCEKDFKRINWGFEECPNNMGFCVPIFIPMFHRGADDRRSLRTSACEAEFGPNQYEPDRPIWLVLGARVRNTPGAPTTEHEMIH